MNNYSLSFVKFPYGQGHSPDEARDGLISGFLNLLFFLVLTGISGYFPFQVDSGILLEPLNESRVWFKTVQGTCHICLPLEGLIPHKNCFGSLSDSSETTT